MPDASLPRVIVLADDLIWGTRIARLVSAAGAEPVAVRSAEALAAALVPDAGQRPPDVIVDLTSRAYDPIAALRIASDAGVHALAVGQHDAAEQRRAAREAGASRLLAYRQLAENGERIVRDWLSPRSVGSRIDAA